jgi:acyl-CoA thioester hydrolase
MNETTRTARQGSFAAPILAWRGAVLSSWIDANGHMTSMAYPPLFHANCPALFRSIGIGPGYLEKRRLSIFQREFRLSFERELKPGDRIEIRSWLVAHDRKRLHHFHELWLRETDRDHRAAFAEYMSLHIDIATRRTAPFPQDVQERIEEVAAVFAQIELPLGTGAPIGLERDDVSLTRRDGADFGAG